ncbi:hypothetical protein [Allocoleopsis franciscana]|nr:hypothetical protein [Allocoleopsis franciscana]
MKRKFFSVIFVTCATSLWLAPTPEAFAHSIEPQANVDASQALLSEKGNSKSESSALTDDQGLRLESQSTAETTASVVATASETRESSQPSSSTQTVQVNKIVGGIFGIFLLIGYILGGLQYRKYRSRRATVLLRQIETLERIWKMEHYR